MKFTTDPMNTIFTIVWLSFAMVIASDGGRIPIWLAVAYIALAMLVAFKQGVESKND